MTEADPKGHEAEEHSVLQRIIAGESREYEVLVLKHQDAIYAMIMRQVGDPAVARELTQDTFLRAYLNLKGFRRESSFSTWLTRIALNISNSYFSSRRYKDSLKSTPFEPRAHEALLSEEQAAAYSEEQNLCLLQKFIGTLKPALRDVVVLCAIEGKSYREAAAVLDIPPGTVASRLNTAVKALREKFKRCGS